MSGKKKSVDQQKPKGAKKKIAQGAKVTAAAGLALGIAFSGSASSLAAIGGGGAGGSGGGGGGPASNWLLLTYDNATYLPNPPQGWGNDSIEAFKAMLATNTAYQPMQDLNAIPGGSTQTHFDKYIRSSCAGALTQASERSGVPGARARVVQMGFTMGNVGIGGSWVPAVGGTDADFRNWYNSIADSENLNNLFAWPAEQRNMVKQSFNDNIVSQPRAVCVAVNEFELPPPDYALNISTDKGSTFAMAGSISGANDVIHASTGSSDIRERLNAKINLHWDGPEGQKVMRSKDVNIANSGDTRSPDFTPADFGWSSWPSGGFWFDVTVAKQGKMQGAVDTPDNDPRESWSANALTPTKTLTHGGSTTPLGNTEVLASGMFYDARIKAHSNGYSSSMTITDAISTDKVFIGAKDQDVASAAYVLDPAGNKVAGATITINRGVAGTVSVAGTVPNITVQGEYTLVVPTYVLPTKADYSIADQSHVCYTATQKACLDGNNKVTRKVTPAPDKVWVLDEKGGLVASDPNHTNTEGSDGQVFLPGDGVSAVVNGRIPANLAENLTTYKLTDDWTKAAKYVDFSNASKAKVFYEGKDVTADFDVKVTGTVTTATAKAAFLAKTKGLGADAPVKLIISGAFKTDYDTNEVPAVLHNNGSETWNNEVKDTNEPPVFTITMTPDKVWVLDENGGLTIGDPDWTNNQGVDNAVFLPGDAVSAVVNGAIPGNLAGNMSNYQLIDDWSKAAKYVDFSNVAKAKVFADGKDVTSQFDVKIEGTTTTATAKASFLATTAGMKADKKMKLIISGSFRTDYVTKGEKVILHNNGSEVWNNEVKETNEPPVFTWTPDPHKQVNGSADESGDKAHDDINGLTVFPGQKLEYAIQLDMRIPANTARGVKSLSLVDSFDPQFTPDKGSVEFFDSRTNKPIARSAYKLSFDEANHSFTADFTPEWIAANVNADGANSQWENGGWLMVRFTGAVKADTVGGGTVKNQAFQVINGVKTATEIPEVKIPSIKPDKEDLNTNLDNIDGKTVVQGDHILYRLTLDGGPAKDKLAYNVHKLGMVDDFDQDYLDLNVEGIKVNNKATGADVSDKFNIQIKDGVAYIFAKQVDSTNAYGDKIAGDPQPDDLAAYDAAAILPHTTPIIDQDLLGHEYWITLDTVVSKEVNDYTIKNQARQNIQNTNHMTKIVSNPLKDIDPSKDVVIDESAKDESIDGKEVKLYSTFNYRLNSSELPANRAYGASQWSLTDQFDKVHDSFTGIWAVYANADVYEGDKLIFKKGALLADSAGHESEPYGELFTSTWDADTATFKVEATQKYLDMVNTRGDLVQSFSVYTKMERIAPSEEVLNKVTEKYNKVDRESNVVKTNTPENPAIDVEKFTLEEGLEKGDRDDIAAALNLTPDQLKNGVKVGFQIKNTGDVPLTNLTFADAVAKGTFGSVDDVVCEVPLDEATAAALNNGSETKAGKTTWIAASELKGLAVGEVINCQGTLTGMEPGMSHSDTVTVTGESVFTKKKVEDADSWHAKAPETPAITVVKYTLEEGMEKGDRNLFKDALVLTPEQAKNGLKIGFHITNTGDVPLKNVNLSDATLDSTTGKVDGIVCADPQAAPVAPETVAPQKPATEAKTVDLGVGETMDCVGTLSGVEEGKSHVDLATVTGESKYTGQKVSAVDPWNAVLPAADGAKPVDPGTDKVVNEKKGAVTGEAVTQQNPLLIGGGIAAMLAALGGAVMYAVSRKRRAALAAATAQSDPSED